MNHTLPVRFGRWLLFVGPAAGLFVLELLHPNAHALGTVYQSVSPVVDWWIQLHLLLFVRFQPRRGDLLHLKLQQIQLLPVGLIINH